MAPPTSGADGVVTGSRDAERAAFIARVTAGATHELRNFFAIVKESAGLVGDLVQAAGPDRPVSREKVDWALERIRLQIQRGTELTDSLNRVMHGLDHPTEAVGLGDATEHAALLAQRFARRRQCEIQVEEGADLTVTVNALDLFRALVEVMEWCVEGLEPDGRVRVRAEAAGEQPAVRFTPEPADRLRDLEDADRQRLESTVEAIAGRLEHAGGSLLLRLTATSSG